ncbi:MAG: dihydrofolate reductase [Clostridia bacterium]|jgi:phosphoglycerate dehydrogenase-like enzyme|nr:dihydrofolate reductase [Clostridia bacterium]
MKALFTYNYGTEKMNAIKELGYELIYVDEHVVSNTGDISDIDVLVCYNPFEKLDISKLKQLKWIQLSSIGIDQVPKDKVKEHDILVTNNRSGYSIPMGEWIVMKILELLKNSKSLYQKQSERKWQMDTSLLELYNKTVCFVGTGSIASEAAKRLQGFDVNIIGINTTGKSITHFNSCYKMTELNQALAQSDVVILSIPSTEATYHLINEATLSHFKKGACLINISRGSVIKESALIEALGLGNLRGAALDVFEEEPLPPDSALWNLDNIIITPHNSWISEMRNERRFDIIYNNLKRYIAGEKLANVIEIEKGY